MTVDGSATPQQRDDLDKMVPSPDAPLKDQGLDVLARVAVGVGVGV